MANDYSTIKENYKSRKFFLVRANPARDLTGEAVLVSGTIYKIETDFDEVNRLEIEDLSLSRVTTTTPGAFEYSFISGVIYFNMSAAVAIDDLIVAYYCLFFTDGQSTFANIDPYNSTGELVKWYPRLISNPRLSISQKNVFFGIIEISNDKIDLINTDKELNQYFSNKDSWSNKEIIVWHCLDNIENISNFYKGFTSDIGISDQVEISVDNIFNQFNKTFETLTISTRLPSGFFNPEDDGKIVPIVYQEFSPGVFNNKSGGDSPTHETDVANSLANFHYDYTTLLEAITISYFAVSGANYSWIAHHDRGFGDYTDTVVGFTSFSADVKFIQVADKSKYIVTDQIVLTQSGNSCVYLVLSNAYGASSSQIVVQLRHIISGSASFSAGATITIPKINYVLMYDPRPSVASVYSGWLLPLCYWRDYKIQTTLLGSLGNFAVHEIVLQSGFQANYTQYTGEGNVFDENCKIFYRARESRANLNHADIIQEIVEESGLAIDSTTFATASATPILADFSYPEFKGTSYSSYRDILSLILQSTLGTLGISDDFSIKYFLTNTPAASMEITKNEIIDGSFSQRISHTDLVSKLEMPNPDGSFFLPHEYSNPPDPDDSTLYREYSILKSSQVHGIDKILSLRMMLSIDSFETYVLNRMEAMYGERYLNISIDTKTINMETEINDDITLVTDDLVGDSDTKNLTVIEITKERERVSLVLTDFLNL